MKLIDIKNESQADPFILRLRHGQKGRRAVPRGRPLRQMGEFRDLRRDTGQKGILGAVRHRD